LYRTTVRKSCLAVIITSGCKQQSKKNVCPYTDIITTSELMKEVQKNIQTALTLHPEEYTDNTDFIPRISRQH
jgi:16S rRNA U1498 N3-methylase RsmE